LKKQTFIINGNAGVGKDTFVEMVELALRNYINIDYWIENYSSVTRVKEIMKKCGWDGKSKTEKDRKFMSDLKLLLTGYNDLPFKDMSYVREGFLHDGFDNSKMLFLHIREPEEIARAAKEFDAKTILIKRDSVRHITSNMADENVYNYDYDIIIENNGTYDGLYEKAKQFVRDYASDCLKERY
jgi:hypothetical protein